MLFDRLKKGLSRFGYAVDLLIVFLRFTLERGNVAGFYAARLFSLSFNQIFLICAILSLILVGWQPLAAQDSSGFATILDINKANNKGISHNLLDNLDVGYEGMVLNNSTEITNTQLRGYIGANENLTSGSADLIILENSGSTPGVVNGFFEVAGPSAELIVASPSGLTCNGCGFINTPKATLTTSKPSFSDDGSLSQMVEGEGAITVGNRGLSVVNADNFSIISNRLKVDGRIVGKKVNITLGSYESLTFGKDTVSDQLALDVGLLGGVRADSIYLLSKRPSERNLIRGQLIANETLDIRTLGEFSSSKESVLFAGTSFDYDGLSDVSFFGYVKSDGTVNISSGQDIDMTGLVISNNSTVISAFNELTVTPGNFDLSLYSLGSVYLEGITINYNGLHIVGGDFSFRYAILNNGGAEVEMTDYLEEVVTRYPDNSSDQPLPADNNTLSFEEFISSEAFQDKLGNRDGQLLSLIEDGHSSESNTAATNPQLSSADIAGVEEVSVPLSALKTPASSSETSGTAQKRTFIPSPGVLLGANQVASGRFNAQGMLVFDQ